MKDTFTSWLLKIMAVVLSLSSFVVSLLNFDFILLETDMGALGWLASMLIVPLLIFCILNGFAEHLRYLSNISDKLDNLVEINKKADEENAELNNYGDLNNMSL